MPRQVEKRRKRRRRRRRRRGKRSGVGLSKWRQGSGILKEEERTTFSFILLSLSHMKCLFFFKPRTDDYTTTQFKLCTKDYMTMYPV